MFAPMVTGPRCGPVAGVAAFQQCLASSANFAGRFTKGRESSAWMYGTWLPLLQSQYAEPLSVAANLESGITASNPLTSCCCGCAGFLANKGMALSSVKARPGRSLVSPLTEYLSGGPRGRT